jgi:hypothetical protein
MAKAHWQSSGAQPVEIRSRGFWHSGFVRSGFGRAKVAGSGQQRRGQRRAWVVFREGIGRLWRLLTKRLQATPRKLFVSETATLGERRSIVVVEFERRRFLVGCSAGSVNLLAQLPDAEIGADPKIGAEPKRDSQHQGRENLGRENDGRENYRRENHGPGNDERGSGESE